MASNLEQVKPKLHLYDLLWICCTTSWSWMLWICSRFLVHVVDMLWICCGLVVGVLYMTIIILYKMTSADDMDNALLACTLVKNHD